MSLAVHDAAVRKHATARLERRRAELRRFLEQIDTEPSAEHPIAPWAGRAEANADARGGTALEVGPDGFEPDGCVEELELRAVEGALARLANGTFGACELCGGPIERARLDAVPWSRSCAVCIHFCERELRTMEQEPDRRGCAECAERSSSGDPPEDERTGERTGVRRRPGRPRRAA